MMDRPVKVSFVSLGCPKNLVDSEKMLGQLAEAGCLVGCDHDQADVIVVNTCGFLAESRAEAHAAIRDAAATRRSHGRGRPRVVVAGCLVQRDGQRLLHDVPGIDALVGVNNREDVVAAVLAGPRRTRASESGPIDGQSARPGQGATGGLSASARAVRLPVAPDWGSGSKATLYLGEYHPSSRTWTDQARLRLTPRHYAYLRISEGCDQRCTFCTIPAIRGPMHSKTPEQIEAEARELIADGAVELILIGQDTTSYGGDLGERGGLAALLRRLDRLEGVGWIRLMYVYPSVLTDEMIETIGSAGHVVPYVDIPLQHINDRILRAMYRRVTRAETLALLDKLRQRIPGVFVRTTMITGFPGESEAEFQELVDFVRDFKFDALGVFPYSTEPETPAGRMKDQLPPAVRRERADALMRVQQEVAFAKAAAMKGRRFEVLVDARADAGPWIARHAGQAPEVDSVSLVEGEGLRPGRRLEVVCTGSRGYDLLARPARVKLPVLQRA